MPVRSSLLALALCIAAFPIADLAQPALSVGAAKIDVTPQTPVRLCGYLARKAESEGVETPLYARALAIGSAPADAAVLVTIDSTAISAAITDAVSARIKESTGLSRERLTFCVTHTHAAPCLTGTLVNIFGQPLQPPEQAHVDQYTQFLSDRLVDVVKQALADMKPATLFIGRGSAPFAANRRKPPGPVDHEMPLLVARDAATGKIRALVANYACHCTTLGANINKTHGDWAGFACAAMEAANPGAVAMVTIGCGADQNPMPRGDFAQAKTYGSQIAAEAARLLTTDLHPIHAAPQTQLTRIQLAFDHLPTRAQWEELAKKNDPTGYNARTQLAKLDRGESLPTELPYTVQTWTFGDELAMVFLSGEVVVDYALRLKNDFDPNRLWVSAYSNDVPCYIPSRRVLAEGGYEGGGAMIYYGRPAPFAPAVENDIVRTVHTLLPTTFRSQQSLNEFPLPKSIPDSLKSFKLPDGLTIDVAAAEPLVASPVAIDWDLKGRMWVLEMYDYPSGLHDNQTPGGRVVILESTRHDGRYDKRTVFLEGLRYPMGLMCWRNGALICAAPDIIYATPNAQGTCSLGSQNAKILFTGFGTDNQQWAVNGLAWGLDGWVYGASSIHNDPIQIPALGKTIDLGGRDFRMNPDTLAFEPAAGRTQFCRVRTDFDDWFGNDNSNPLWQYPLPEHYARRNPHVTLPNGRVPVSKESDPTRVYPASRILERFNQPQSANHVTSGCGPAIYRDTLLGDAWYHNAFFCEPVHNVVSRLILTRDGPLFQGHRAPENAASEFLASTDNWFRPVQVRSGPDGALYVVDMHRFMIEHTRWIPAGRLATLDTRAGADTGRIYRIYPKNNHPRPFEDLSTLSTPDLAAKLDSPNGTLRDLIDRELTHRADAAVVPTLFKLLHHAQSPAVRAQALSTNARVGSASADGIAAISIALTDPSPDVRRVALRTAESHLRDETLLKNVLNLADDPDPAVRHQLALTLGEWTDARTVPTLAHLLAANLDDPWIRAAVYTSSASHPFEILTAFLGEKTPAVPARHEIIRNLALTAAATADPDVVSQCILAVLPADESNLEPWRLGLAASLLDTLARRRVEVTAPAHDRLSATTDFARQIAADAHAPAPARLAALPLLSRDPSTRDADFQLLATLLSKDTDPSLQSAAISAIARTGHKDAASTLIASWPTATPQARTQLATVLTSRPALTYPFLDALADKRIPATQLPITIRDRLLKSADTTLAQRSAKILAAAKPPSRSAIVKQFESALTLKGSPAAGAALFAKTCSACHQINNVGHPVGPNLIALTDRSAPALLTAILDPNAAVAGEFVAFSADLTDGRNVTGLLVEDSPAGYTLLQPNSLRETLPRDSVKKITSTNLSLMPEGLETGLTPQDLANLISYLQSNETPQTFATTLAHPDTTDTQRATALATRPDLALPAIEQLLTQPPNPTRLTALKSAAKTVLERHDESELQKLRELASPGAGAAPTDYQLALREALGVH